MTDLRYLNIEKIREEGRYYFERDFSHIDSTYTIGANGARQYKQEYNQYFDVYRHTYGSAVLTREFGEDFAKLPTAVVKNLFIGLQLESNINCLLQYP